MKTSSVLLAAVLAAASALSGCATHSCKSGIRLPDESTFTRLDFDKAPSRHVYPVYKRKSSGPPLLVLHEANGLSAPPLDFALEAARHGWTAYAPVLFGKYGDAKPILSLLKLEFNPRWKLHDPYDSGIVLDDVAAMVGWISERHGGQRVVVMGNCLTGGFPIALLGRRDVKAAVLCQPAMPTPRILVKLLKAESEEARREMAVPERQVNASIQALRGDYTKVLLGFHYLEDPLAPFEKFDRLHERLQHAGIAGRFRPVVLVPRGPARRENWWEVYETDVPRSASKPHNTVTESGSPKDRREMRRRLFAKLAPLRGG